MSINNTDDSTAEANLRRYEAMRLIHCLECTQSQIDQSRMNSRKWFPTYCSYLPRSTADTTKLHFRCFSTELTSPMSMKTDRLVHKNDFVNLVLMFSIMT